MGSLSINRNLLSKFIPKSLSNLCFIRTIFSPAAVPAVKPNTCKSKFLIEHVYKGTTNYSLLSADKDHHRIRSPFSGRPGKHSLVGSCKEWTLFWPDYKDEDKNLYGVEYDGNSFHQPQRRLSLWDPTTNRVKTLPPSLLPRTQPVRSIDIRCFGFGFDPKSQDYKLVCFLEYNYLYSSYDDIGIELYSLKTDSWKQINPSHYVTGPVFPRQSVHINGVCYWADEWTILSFDFADENLSDISLPGAPSFLQGMRSNYCLAEFHDSLAIIVPTEEEKQQNFTIWVWNGETWNEAPRCAVGDFPVGYEVARLLGLFQNEYFFIQGDDEAELMLFNCKTGKLENLGIRHAPKVFPYTVPI